MQVVSTFCGHQLNGDVPRPTRFDVVAKTRSTAGAQRKLAGHANAMPLPFFWFASLTIHVVALWLAAPATWFSYPTVERTVITARLVPPDRTPTLELPPLPPPSESRPLPGARPHFMPARAVVSAPSVSISLPRFIVTAAPTPLWTFRLPASLAVAQNAPPGPSAAAEPSGPSAAVGSSGTPAATGSQGGTTDNAGGPFAIPAYRQTPLPVYPSLAKARHWEGVTLLRVEVLTDGRVGRVELIASSGHAALDESAIHAVHGWQFEPAKRGDTAVVCSIQVPIRFKLDRSGA